MFLQRIAIQWIDLQLEFISCCIGTDLLSKTACWHMCNDLVFYTFLTGYVCTFFNFDIFALHCIFLHVVALGEICTDGLEQQITVLHIIVGAL